MSIKFQGEPKREEESWVDFLKRSRLDTLNTLKLSLILFVIVTVAVAAIQGLLALIIG